MTERKRTRFRRANQRIDELVNDPLIAGDVQRYAAEREHTNRVYARGLAEIRKASNLTQQQLATCSTQTRAPSLASNAPRICCCRPCPTTSRRRELDTHGSWWKKTASTSRLNSTHSEECRKDEGARLRYAIRAARRGSAIQPSPSIP